MNHRKPNDKQRGVEITPLLVSKYILGTATMKEWLAVTAAMDKDPSLMERVILCKELGKDFSKPRPLANSDNKSVCIIISMRKQTIPVDKMAASSEANDCVVRCEQFVLEQRGRKADYEELFKEAKSREWLHDKGTPLYNIGRLLELVPLSVSRRFKGSLDLIADELAANCSIIVALNSEALTKPRTSAEAKPDHAVVVLSIDSKNDEVEVIDPSGRPYRRRYPTKDFLRAWKKSKNFFVSIVERGMRPYTPHPEYVAHIKLPNDIVPVADMLAENAHEIWAVDRIAEAKKKQAEGIDMNPYKNSFMKPFLELSKGERKGDYLTALNTIKLIIKLGYDIKIPDQSGFSYESNKRGTDGRYVPSPIDVSDVELPEEINALTEYIAENSHEEWAKLRLREGWTFAPETKRELKQSFDLVPYCELLDSEKDYDRKMAMYTLKVLYKLGCTIRKRPSSR